MLGPPPPSIQHLFVGVQFCERCWSFPGGGGAEGTLLSVGSHAHVGIHPAVRAGLRAGSRARLRAACRASGKLCFL